MQSVAANQPHLHLHHARLSAVHIVIEATQAMHGNPGSRAPDAAPAVIYEEDQ